MSPNASDHAHNNTVICDPLEMCPLPSGKGENGNLSIRRAPLFDLHSSTVCKYPKTSHTLWRMIKNPSSFSLSITEHIPSHYSCLSGHGEFFILPPLNCPLQLTRGKTLSHQLIRSGFDSTCATEPRKMYQYALDVVMGDCYS